MKELCPELSEAMDTVIRSANYIKICPLKSRLFAEMCKEMRAQYQSLLFYSNSRWLSRKCGLCLQLASSSSTVFRRGNSVRAEHFISKLAHLSDIF
jgi:hypothetical protein